MHLVDVLRFTIVVLILIYCTSNGVQALRLVSMSENSFDPSRIILIEMKGEVSRGASARISDMPDGPDLVRTADPDSLGRGHDVI